MEAHKYTPKTKKKICSSYDWSLKRGLSTILVLKTLSNLYKRQKLLRTGSDCGPAKNNKKKENFGHILHIFSKRIQTCKWKKHGWQKIWVLESNIQHTYEHYDLSQSNNPIIEKENHIRTPREYLLMLLAKIIPWKSVIINLGVKDKAWKCCGDVPVQI